MQKSTGLRIFVVATLVLTSLILPSHLYAKSDAPKAESKNLMPESMAKVPSATVSEADLFQKGMTVGKEKDGKRFYSDGRLAKEKVGTETRVYTYQDDISGMMMYRMDQKARTYVIEQYVGGILNSSLDADGVYQTYYTDGTVEQRIDPVTFNAFYFDYGYEQITVTDAEGNSFPVTVMTEKNAYLNTAAGRTLYSTTSFDRVGDSVTETTTYHMTGEQEVVKDGRLIQSTDKDGLVTNYTYESNKKGVVVKMVATRSDGKVTVTDMRDQVVKKPTLDFGKVLRAALKSVKNPNSPIIVKTKNKNVYELQSGDMNKFTLTTQNAVYYFENGVLLSTVNKDGQTIVRKQDAEYIRI